MSSIGPNSPGTCADDATVGTVAWSNPDNAKASDNVYTTLSSFDIVNTDYLKATNFGFSIPSGSTIDGILVEIEEKKSVPTTNRVIDNIISIVKSDGSIGSLNKARSNTTFWSTAESYIPYGSLSDLWGESWSVSDINSANFGVVLSAHINLPDIAQTIISVDHIRITVYYTETSGATITGVQSITGIGSITL